MAWRRASGASASNTAPAKTPSAMNNVALSSLIVALEELRAAGQTLQIRVLGLATIADDVSPKLALQTIASVEVLGAFRATAAVKAALAPRIV